MVTAYTTPSALHVDRAEIDILLVGDSLAMVELGMETTQGVGMDEVREGGGAASGMSEANRMKLLTANPVSRRFAHRR